jgi:aminoglycoside phosphotransferase (APT) family kinase protein
MSLGPEVGAIREEQDWASLERYLAQRLGLTGPLEVRQFPHGFANLTYLVTAGDSRAVLRRPPFGTIAPGAHDMGREYRVLTALAPVYDRAPTTLLECRDNDVLGAPFLLMEYRAGGEVIRDRMPESFAGQPNLGPRVSAAFIEAAADLHRLVPDEIGLGDIGRPDGFGARQLRGYAKRWAAVAPGSAKLDRTMRHVHDRLADTLPEPPRVSLVHNDLKLDNCQFRVGDPDRVQSVFDWDMATLGDPLFDLGVLLNYWPDVGPEGELARQLWPEQGALGLASRDWMADRYADLLGVDLSRLPWYRAVSAWKTAVQLRQLAARFERGETDDVRMQDYADAVHTASALAEALLASDQSA